MKPMVSFVIPVINDAARLERCLRSIRANEYPADRLEIVVVDNGSTDDSPAVATRLGARVLVLAGSRVGALRNLGVSAATGEVIAFVDADHEIVTGWVGCAVEELADERVGVVGADCLGPPDGGRVQQAYGRLRRRPEGRYEVDWLGSGNMALRRSAFDAVGGFDTSLEACEDVDLCRKLRGRGLKIIADSRMGSIHYGDPESLPRVFFGELWRGRDNVKVSLRPPRGWRILASAAVPVLNIAALILCLAGLLSGSGVGRVLGFSAGGFLVAQFALRATAISWRDRFRGWVPAFGVASAYELGRALAIIWRAGHGRRRQGAAT
jgi:GT2 family glycosyltransferase